MNKLLCSFACNWITIINSQFYITDSLSFDVSLESNANLVVAWLYQKSLRFGNLASIPNGAFHPDLCSL